MKKSIFQEITPLSKENCFIIFFREKKEFAYPIHMHEEYELNFIENAKGAQRVVGDSLETIDDLELTLITGAKLEHAWLTHECKSDSIKEITIQFHPDLLSEGLLSKSQFKTIDDLFRKAMRGVTFPASTIRQVKSRLEDLSKESRGIHSVLELISIFYDLSISPNIRVLSNTVSASDASLFDSRRIDRAYQYMQENYNRNIHLSDVAAYTGMSDVAFSRFIKARTGKNFIDTLNDIRLGQVVHLLINTTNSISEICYSCGFNNLSNFNRFFLKKKKCTPREFRENYWKNRILI